MKPKLRAAVAEDSGGDKGLDVSLRNRCKIGSGDNRSQCENIHCQVAEPPIAPRLALVVAAPLAKVVAKPGVSIEATEGSDEAHVTRLVKSRALLSLQVPVALNCCVEFTAMEGAAGVTVIEL